MEQWTIGTISDAFEEANEPQGLYDAPHSSSASSSKKLTALKDSSLKRSSVCTSSPSSLLRPSSKSGFAKGRKTSFFRSNKRLSVRGSLHPSAFHGSPRASPRGSACVPGDAFLAKSEHDKKKLRHKVANAFSEFMEVAMFRLMAAEAHQLSPPTKSQDTKFKGHKHAWPHRSIPPLMWIPFSLCLTAHTKPKSMAANQKNKQKKRQLRSITTLEFGAGLTLLRGRVRQDVPEKAIPEIGHQNHHAQNDDVVLDSCDKLREAFRVAVSEAKLAQAQSLAASRDVQNLKSELERCKRLVGSHNATGSVAGRGMHRAPPRGGGGAKAAAAAAAQPHLKEQLLAQRDYLRRLEHSLKQEIQDVAGQTQRLQEEIYKRHQRASTAPCSFGGSAKSPLVVSSTDQPLDWSPGKEQSAKAAPVGAQVAAKFLTSSRVLPDISGAQFQPRQFTPVVKSGAHTARGRLETSKLSQGRPPQGELPSVPWRAGTAS